MDTEQARTNMMTQQLQAWGVLDSHVLDVIAQVPREQFVPPAYQALAFADMSIPLAHHQAMLTPGEEARILQALNIQSTDSILEIGTGSGYITALLARLGRHVDSVDIFSDFSKEAQLKLAAQNINNVTLMTGDAASGWEEQVSYDVIVITGSLPYLPNGFRDSLKIHGRLFAILGSAPAMEATLITRQYANDWQIEKLFETVVTPLINAKQLSEFTF